jgi:beta-galactosidase
VPVDSQGAPGYCYDHPGVHQAAEAFLGVLAAHVTGKPNFYAWDLWSEPHIVQWGYFDFLPQPAIFCYCPHTVQRFRDWLKGKYGAIQELNKAWYRQFSSFDLVPAPKFISLMSYTDYIDWITFIQDKLAQDLSWRQEAVRRFDSHLTTSHSAVPGLLTLPLDEQGSPDDWKMARAVEVWGTSFYPKHVGAKESNDPSFRAAMLDSTRSACDTNSAPYWLGELQAGHGYVGMFASHMTETDARFYTLSPLAHGAKGLCFYAWQPMSSGYESAGFGMANLDGSPSERALAAGALARSVSQEMSAFYRAKPARAEAAVCWNNYANLMWQCMRQPWHYIPSRCYLGAYRALYQEHLPVDFIHPDHFSSRLSQYRLLYLPFAFMLPQAAILPIETFVKQGGVVLAEARTGWNDEKGYCGLAVPGFGLEEVFGCREKGVQGVEEGVPVPIRITQAHPAIPLLKPGDMVIGARFKEVLEPLALTSEVVGEFDNGSPAIVVNSYGEGWAIFIGSLLSLGFYKTGDLGAGKLLKGLSKLAEIVPPVTIEGIEAGTEIETCLLEGVEPGGKPYWIFFAFNHTGQKLHPTFGIQLPARGYLAHDVLNQQPCHGKHTGGRWVVKKTLAPYEIWVVKIEQR